MEEILFRNQIHKLIPSRAKSFSGEEENGKDTGKLLFVQVCPERTYLLDNLLPQTPLTIFVKLKYFSKHPSIYYKYLLAIWFLASVKDCSYRVVIFTSIAVNCDISVMSSYVQKHEIDFTAHQPKSFPENNVDGSIFGNKYEYHTS